MLVGQTFVYKLKVLGLNKLQSWRNFMQLVKSLAM